MMSLNEREIGNRVKTLPERFADRIPEVMDKSVLIYRNVGEWRLAAGRLKYLLVKKQTTITTRELHQLQEVMSAMGMPTESLSSLPTRESLTSQQLDGQMTKLPDQFATRVSSEHLEEMRESLDEAEYEDLVSMLIYSLKVSKAAITSQELDQLWLILDALDLPRLELAHLTVS